MTDQNLVVEVDCVTGIATTRSMTQAESDAQAASAAQAQAEADAKAQAEAQAQAIKSSAVSKLAKLGLTDEEIAALVG